jgi:hypothetical protein
MRKSLILLLLSLLIGSSLQSQTASIRGFIYDKATGEAILFTNVILQGTTFGAATDNNGFFLIQGIPSGTYNLFISCLGYDSLIEKLTLKPGDVLNKKYFLNPSSITMGEVNISAAREEARSETKISVVKVTPKEIRQIPTIGGIPDIAQYIQNLPGVIFTGDQGGQLYIRGGSPVQNKVLLDGMIIYNPFHSIGLFSVFETDIIRTADIYTGGFGAEHGGRISSVMDISTRDGNKNRLSGGAGLNPFGARLLIEGPVGKTSPTEPAAASFILAAKNSYLSQTSKVFYNYIDTNGLPFDYTDLYGKFSITGENGSKVNFFGFNFSDHVTYQALSEFKWNMSGGGTQFVVVPGSSNVLMDGNFAYSKYKITLDDEGSAERTSEISGFNMSLGFTYFIGKHKLNYGIEMLGFTTDYFFYTLENRIISDRQNTTELAGYMKYKWTIGEFIIEPSFRAHYYASLSEFSPEPRLAIKYKVSDRLRLKFAGGLYSQNLIAANSDRDVVNLFYGFVSGPENIPSTFDGKKVTSKLQTAQHLIIGAEIDINKRLSLNIEGYLKNFPQLTNLNRNKIFDEQSGDYNDVPDYFKKDFIIESGNAEGVDMSLKYNSMHLSIWAVYSLGWINRYDGYTNYTPHYDRRHNVNLTFSWEFGDRYLWELSSRWNYGSGFPFTQTQGFYEQIPFDEGINMDYIHANGSLGILYGEVNMGRLPDYHRLDFSIKRSIHLSETTFMEVAFSVTNLYDRDNIFYFDRIRYTRVNQLPFMPSLGVNITF